MNDVECCDQNVYAHTLSGPSYVRKSDAKRKESCSFVKIYIRYIERVKRATASTSSNDRALRAYNSRTAVHSPLHRT